jgi:hypothetical protein
MIQIRYSPAPYPELELRGSNAELAALQDEIRRFAEGNESEIRLEAESSYNPTPYEMVLAGILIRKTIGRIEIRVERSELHLKAKPALLCRFADTLPSDAVLTSEVGYHVHFDRLGREDWFSEESLDIVFALKR